MTATVAFERRDIRVIGLVSGAHFFSHFFFLTLPPLYPILRVEMGVSYTALGATATAFAIASGIGQLPVGFIVDRFGARYVLIGGITLMSLAIGGMGLVPSYFWLPVLALVAGGANSVFHPADYAILSHTVKGTRVGRAYSIHTFSGFLGWAVAPPFMTLIATQWGWRTALFCACTAGLIMAVVLILRRDELIVPTRAAALPGSKKSGGFDVLLHPGILILFCFFIANAMTSVGINTRSRPIWSQALAAFCWAAISPTARNDTNWWRLSAMWPRRRPCWPSPGRIWARYPSSRPSLWRGSCWAASCPRATCWCAR